MSSDIVERLRHVAWLAEEGSKVTDMAATAANEIERLTNERNGWQATAAGLSQDISNAEDEIERLERWKTDATYVINAWEEAWESAAVPDNLGATKSEAMLDEITRLRAEVKRLGVENDQCVRTLNQYMEAVQQMVTLLAEKDAKIERLRAAGDLLAEDLGDNPWADRLIAAWWEARRERP
jgi:chromosome segregation ATPase